MSLLQDIADIFSGFHDGVITAYEGNYEKLLLTVECSYLAERINPDYERFYVEGLNLRKIELHTWRPDNHSEKILFDLKKIFQTELEISRATVIDDDVLVHCYVDDIDYDYSGGALCLNCSDVKIYDQGHTLLTADFFNEIVGGYWDSIRNRRN